MSEVRGRLWRMMRLPLLWVSLAVAVPTVGSAQEQQVTVVFRYDDYSYRTPADLEVRIIEAFGVTGLPVTFGVIPFACPADCLSPDLPPRVLPLSTEKVAILKRAVERGIVEAALHGYSHSADNWRNPGRTEFSGMSYDGQLHRLRRGKAELEDMLGVRVSTFIPPYNMYDPNTVRAVEAAGFSTISASRSRVAPRWSGLRFLPETTPLHRLQEVVQEARGSAETEPILVVLFHDFDFRDVDPVRGKMSFDEFARLLSWIASQPDIRVYTIREAGRLLPGLDARRLSSFSGFPPVSGRRLAPASLKGTLFPELDFYPSLSTLRWMRVVGWGVVAGLYAGVLGMTVLVSALAGSRVKWKRSGVAAVVPYGVLLLLAGGVAYVLADRAIYVRGAMALTCLVGVAVGIWGSFVRATRAGRVA